MYLFFDTETTGLPGNWKAPLTDLSNWPRMVQLAWLLYDSKGELQEENNYIIKPDNYTIPREVSKIHGITTAMAKKEGHDLKKVLVKFKKHLSKTDCLVAHNIRFDEKIVGAEFLRLMMKNSLEGKQKICTMLSSTNYCRIPGRYGNKWPKLSELHYNLFRTGFDEAHNAAVDIHVTAKCFWKMREMGVI
jgi:DNA polymerase III epsilon subunit-like protein